MDDSAVFHGTSACPGCAVSGGINPQAAPSSSAQTMTAQWDLMLAGKLPGSDLLRNTMVRLRQNSEVILAPQDAYPKYWLQKVRRLVSPCRVQSKGISSSERQLVLLKPRSKQR